MHDLTRIRAIDESLQTSLKGLGVGSYADIAAWKPSDVARISTALKIPGRIEQENWIEQAQILAKGGETYYSRRKGKGELASSRPTPDEGERVTVRVPAGTRVDTPEPAPVAAALAAAALSAAAPTTTPATTSAAAATANLQSAAATAAVAVQAAQAAVGAKAVAAVASAAAVAAAAPVVAVPAAQALAAATSATVGAPPTAAVAAVAVAAAAAPPAPAPVPTPAAVSAPTVGITRDNLQRIAGINTEVERLLNVQGVTRYAQISSWSPSDVSRFDRLLGFEGRIARENWIEQANILAKGGETAYARDLARKAAEPPRPAKLADAIQVVTSQQSTPPNAASTAAVAVAAAVAAVTPAADAASKSELSNLRSVRSEAYRGPDAGPAVGGRGTDDLKRIRGVGVLIEKKLNALGVSRYDQVANWTQADIERFSDKLDFKGRIERENWVEQARILSAGGQTEFSQRVDRGDVESSKPG